jgi:1,4-dihydroxy-2-naphthoate octaprenyltransferase
VTIPLAAWLAATRPRTLGATAVPVAVGLALAAAAGPLDPWVATWTLVAALLVQVTTNFANDYYDTLRGADGPDRLGPPRFSQAGPVARRAMGRATVVAIGGAVLAAIPLVVRGGWPIVGLGVVALACAVAFTGGPLPLAYLGLGDVFVFVFFGPVAVCGTYWLQRGTVSGHALVASLPVGALAAAILVVNNLRDVRSDARAGKRTLAVRLGPRATRGLYLVLVGLAFLAAPLAGTVLPLAAAPLAVLESRRLLRREGCALNASLGGTARLHAIVGLLLAAGVLA